MIIKLKVNIVTNFFTSFVLMSQSIKSRQEENSIKRQESSNSNINKRKMVKKFSLSLIVILKCSSIVSVNLIQTTIDITNFLIT
jgi:hypothetical protein